MCKGYFKIIFGLITALLTSNLYAQKADLLLKNGHVFDPANQVDTIADVSIIDGKIAEVSQNISSETAKVVVDATGLFVVPGLIDTHTHVFVGPEAKKFTNGINSLSPDDFSFKAGVTTVVDAGTSGWRNFPQFKEQVIDQSKTRILAFLNIAGHGMTGDELESDIGEMNVAKTVEIINQYPNTIVGIKIGHYNGKDWTPFERTIEAGEKTNRPIFVECHLPEYTLEDQLAHMRPGDIITHTFENISERKPVVNQDGTILPVVMEAKERGILFDVGHGGAGFWFDQGIPAIEQGFWPNSFGTDLHRFSMNAGMKDFLNVMSKFLNMGIPLKEVFKRGSWYPAKAIGRNDLGHLGVGAVADIAVLRLREGTFGYIDARNNLLKGDKKLEAELTIKDGKIVWDLNGLSAKPID
ncbi:amidohydrolase/deacetylase family metallohydrolase [Flagellimonas olearia]|uniref:Amidohydrolase/deacetylase family metallohydrolase n=1 Tax=Flagellimonas olearia TaxID=552546 RepID=A0A6I1E8Y1_9FLAO|nr:amidohydrolase/deacetylase family metallohydrolase [Allomuricauda olearia]KAB7530164.1 amidohydrolase/deacetylase family metallohydrolase [Allomuricauda olearia]